MIRLSKVLLFGVFEVYDLRFGQFTALAFREGVQGDQAYAYALQGDQGQTHRGAGATYYTVTALVDGEVEGGFALRTADAGEFRGKHLAVFELGARS